MACHHILMKDQKEFFSKMKERDPDMILKMVKCVISAVKRKKSEIDIFEITFKDHSSMTFGISKSEYKRFLENCLDDLIAVEEYELCAEITKIVKAKSRKKKSETPE
jgi:hypothetical protein